MLAAATFACASPAAPTGTAYTGSFTGEELLSSGTNGIASCAWRMAYTGTMKITLDQKQDGTVSGTADVQATAYSVIAQLLGPAPPDPRCFDYRPIVNNWTLPVTGTPANLVFTGQKQNGTSTTTLTLSGALAGGVISGTATYTESSQSGGSLGSYSSGSATFPVSLR